MADYVATILRGEPDTTMRLPDGTDRKVKHGRYEVARILLRQNYSASDRLSVEWGNGAPSFSPAPIGWLAGLTLTEPRKGGLKRVAYQPMEAA